MIDHLIKQNKQGFTILELVFATTLISVMMGLVLTIVLGALRFYTFSNSIRANQQNGRQIMDDMTRQIRFGTLIEPTLVSPQSKSACIADEATKKLYWYRFNSETKTITKTQFSYLGTLPSSCSAPGLIQDSDPQRISATTMLVTDLQFNRTSGAATVSDISVSGLVIRINFITGTTNTTGGCTAGDIYCNELHFLTAVNIRQRGI